MASEAARPSGPERLVLAFGDSLYAGYGLERGQSLPDAVEARLRRAGVNAEVVNAGVSGDTTAAGRQRLAFALDNLPRKPDLVILGLGGNDVLRQISPAETRANLTAMMDELKRRGVPVLLTGMLAPPNLGPDFRGQFDRIWPDLAGQYNATLYPFILEGVIDNPQLMQADRVHPTAPGVNRIADALAPLAAKRLGAD
jgi:acyl-CoA thioesterase-1